MGLASVAGAKELRDWFGYWPSFHDAEVISLHLNRRGPSSLLLHTWEMTKEVDKQGYYISAKHVIVEFLLREIADLNFSGFSHQNVLSGLSVEPVEDGVRLTLQDTYGIGGTVVAKQISIRQTPGQPSDSE